MIVVVEVIVEVEVIVLTGLVETPEVTVCVVIVVRKTVAAMVVD